MVRKNLAGQEAIEFILITALVFFGALFTVLVFGNKLSAFFGPGSSAVKVANSSSTVIDPTDATRYSQDFDTISQEPEIVEVQQTEPVNISYEPGSSTIKLGQYELTSLPANFNEYLQTSGSSGGTAVMIAAIDELAAQLKADGQLSQSNEVLKLATLGHNLARMEEAIEEAVKACDGNKKCVEKLHESSFPKPPGFDETYVKFPNDIRYTEAIRSLTLGGVMRDVNKNHYNSNNAPGHAFVDQYLKVANSSNFDSPTKSIITELYKNIGILGEDFQNNFTHTKEDGKQHIFDPLTGKDLGASNRAKDPIDAFLQPQTSRITDINSTLIEKVQSN